MYIFINGNHGYWFYVIVYFCLRHHHCFTFHNKAAIAVPNNPHRKMSLSTYWNNAMAAITAQPRNSACVIVLRYVSFVLTPFLSVSSTLSMLFSLAEFTMLMLWMVSVTYCAMICVLSPITVVYVHTYDT